MQNTDINATMNALKEQRNFHADQCAVWQGIAAAGAAVIQQQGEQLEKLQKQLAALAGNSGAAAGPDGMRGDPGSSGKP